MDSRHEIFHSVVASGLNIYESLAIPVLLHGKEP